MEILSSEIVTKFVRYALVGFTGLIVDFSITYTLKEKIQVSKYIANSSGFTVAVITNYILNRIWTFNAESQDVFIQFGTFLMVSLAGLLINNLIIFILNEKLKINFYLSKVMAILVVVLWNFFVNYYYTFRSAV